MQPGASFGRVLSARRKDLDLTQESLARQVVQEVEADRRDSAGSRGSDGVGDVGPRMPPPDRP